VGEGYFSGQRPRISGAHLATAPPILITFTTGGGALKLSW
jgi:hypothetical protein